MKSNKLFLLGLFISLVLVPVKAEFFSRSIVGSWRCLNYSQSWLDLRKDGTAFGVFHGHESPRDEMSWTKSGDGSVTLSSEYQGGYSITMEMEDDGIVYRMHRFRRAEKVTQASGKSSE